jgi:hypothetical protein
VLDSLTADSPAKGAQMKIRLSDDALIVILPRDSVLSSALAPLPAPAPSAPAPQPMSALPEPAKLLESFVTTHCFLSKMLTVK